MRLSQVSLAQLPLSPDSAAGQTVTPVFEGWYVNPDGTRSIAFGYNNRNVSNAFQQGGPSAEFSNEFFG